MQKEIPANAECLIELFGDKTSFHPAVLHMKYMVHSFIYRQDGFELSLNFLQIYTNLMVSVYSFIQIVHFCTSYFKWS